MKIFINPISTGNAYVRQRLEGEGPEKQQCAMFAAVQLQTERRKL